MKGLTYFPCSCILVESGIYISAGCYWLQMTSLSDCCQAILFVSHGVNIPQSCSEAGRIVNAALDCYTGSHYLSISTGDIARTLHSIVYVDRGE